MARHGIANTAVWRLLCAGGTGVPPFGGRGIKPFRIAMVYDAPLAPPTSVALAEEYLELMRAKIHNVLRMCSLKEHDEIVLGAWGCDGRVGPCTERIAELFHEALLGNSDVAHGFKRVTFAISRSSPEDNTLEVFQKQFDDKQRNVYPQHPPQVAGASSP